MSDYDNLPLNACLSIIVVGELKAWYGCVVRVTFDGFWSAVGIASWVQLAWRDDHPPSLSPLPHLHPLNCSPSSKLSHICPLCQVSEPLLRRGRHETRHSSHPLDIHPPPLSKTRMIYLQS
jgi:hypothetical protein